MNVVLSGSLMAKDVQNQQLSKWLERLGCPVDLSPEDLQSLNTPSMRSVWRHLQRHVMPVSTVRTIRKNLLLAKLRTNGLLPGKFGNFKIETVLELAQLQKHSVLQDEVDLLKGKIRAVDENLLSATNHLIEKVTEKERMRHNLEELQDKLALLSLKLASVQGDVEKLDTELEIASILKKCPATQMPYSELKENKLLVSKFVQKFSSVGITDDSFVEMLVSTSDFPPSIIFYGILSVSNHALKTLNSTKIADIWLLSKFPNKPKNFPLSKHLTDLNTTLFKNELELHNCSRKIVAIKAELEKDRAALGKVIKESVTCGNSPGSTLVELVDKIVEMNLEVKREEKCKELLGEIQDVCASDFDQVKWVVSGLKEKEDGLLQSVNEKLSESNKLMGKISTIQVCSVKTGVLQRSRELVSKSLTQLENRRDKQNLCHVLVSENLIGKEIEMFQKIPLVAIARKWEDSFETIPKTVKEDILKSPELFNFLCRSEPKNLIKDIVEKTFWLNTNHRQLSE